MMCIAAVRRRPDLIGLLPSPCRKYATSSNLYTVMGLDSNATAKDIKAAYYKLSKEYHPDSSSSSTESAEKFHDLTTAYETLGNTDKRREYDRQQTRHKTQRIYKTHAHHRQQQRDKQTRNEKREVKWKSANVKPGEEELDVDYENFIRFQRDWRKRIVKSHQSHVPPEFGGGYPFESFYRPPSATSPNDPFIKETFDEKMRRWDEEVQKRARPKVVEHEPDIEDITMKHRRDQDTMGRYLGIRLLFAIGAFSLWGVVQSVLGEYRRREELQQKQWHEKHK